jgi:septal ring factor EnvC (AmiA/AmiB activator)
VTNTDVIRELGKKTSTLEERLDNARSDLKRIDAERSKLAESLIQIDRKFAVVEEHVKELKKVAEEQDRRRWMIVLSVLGCLLTLAANIGLTYFKTQK